MSRYQGLEHGTPYVLKKNGMYYAHNSAGYVHRVLMAELYTESYAKRHASHADEVHAIPLTDLLTGVDEVQEYIDRLVIMRDAMQLQATENLMPPHLQRVVTEKAELDEKLNKLLEFAGTEQFVALDDDEKDRLSRQRDHMAGYSNVLRERIDAWFRER